MAMNRAAFYKALKSKSFGLFGTSLGQKQVEGIEGILNAFVDVGDGKATTLAYVLATAYAEVGSSMVPVREGFAKTDAGARRAVNALAKKRGPTSAVAKYAKPAGPYGHVYYGRGHVQLTWLDNYRESSADAGTDLVKNPDAMLDPAVSARVMIKGMLDGRWNGKGKGLRYYLDKGDAMGARRTVNVQDKAKAIADNYRKFLVAIETAGGVPTKDLSQPSAGETTKPPAPPEVKVPEIPKVVIIATPPEPTEPKKATTFWERMKALFGF